MAEPKKIEKRGNAAAEVKRPFSKLGTGGPQLEEIARMGKTAYNHDEVAAKINALPEDERRKAVEDFMHEAITTGNIDFTDADRIIKKIRLPKKERDELADTYVTGMRV